MRKMVASRDWACQSFLFEALLNLKPQLDGDLVPGISFEVYKLFSIVKFKLPLQKCPRGFR